MNWIQRKVFGLIGGQIHKRLKMKGWVTAVTGLSIIASGIGMILSAFAGDDFKQDLVDSGLGAIVAGATILGFGRKVDRITDALEKNDQSKRPPALTGMVVLACLLGLGTVNAQDISIELGASTYGTSRFAGHGCLIKPLTDSSATIACIEARGNGDGQPVYTTAFGFGQRLQQFGKLSLYGLAQGGTAVSDSAVSGLFNGGACVGFGFRSDMEMIGCGQGMKAPTLGPWEPLVTLGVRYKFTQ